MSRRDFLIQNGDIVIEDGKDLAFVEGDAAIAQHIRLKLKLQLGEWFLDTNEGTDWDGEVFGLGKTDEQIETEIDRSVRGVLGVTNVTLIEITRDRAQRTVSITVNARVDSGQLVAVTVGG